MNSAILKNVTLRGGLTSFFFRMLVFSPNSRELAVKDTRDVLRVWDTCAICQNPTRLAQLAAQDGVPELTRGEHATFGVS